MDTYSSRHAHLEPSRLSCWMTGLDVPQPTRRVRARDRRTTLRKAHHILRMANQLFRHWVMLRSTRKDDFQRGHELGTSWARSLLAELGIRVELTGAPVMLNPGLYVGNHQSFLDILVWMASAPCSFLAKAAVAKAPMVGWGATTLGTVWVHRSSKGSRTAAREALARGVIEEQRRVVVFAEGTTSVRGGTWKRGSFEVAAEHKMQVQAAGICFDNIDACAYLDQSFMKVIADVIEAPPITAHLHLFEPVVVEDADAERRRMAAQVQTWLDAKLDQVGWTK